MTPAGWASTLLGSAIVLWTTRDVFHTLWHPSGSGHLSRWVGRLLWRTAARSRRDRRPSAGPRMLLTVVLVWALGYLLGYALVYLPHLPEGFVHGSGVEPGAPVVDALYVSAVALSTLGLGDVVPHLAWLRPVVALEALMGFGLLSASVSWLLQIAPALTRRRALAVHLAALERAGAQVVRESPSATELLLLARDVATVRVDLRQFDESYYFREEDPTASLAAALEHAGALVAAARRGDADQQAAGAVLGAALDDLAALLADAYVGAGGTREEVFARYAADQGVARGVPGP